MSKQNPSLLQGLHPESSVGTRPGDRGHLKGGLIESAGKQAGVLEASLLYTAAAIGSRRAVLWGELTDALSPGDH